MCSSDLNTRYFRFVGQRFFFALFFLIRFAFNLGFVHRPLFAAALWALFTWQIQPALGAGIFFELLWLDLFPAGTFIPPQSLLALSIASSSICSNSRLIPRCV